MASTCNIIFIGNSYTFQNDLPRTLTRLVADDGGDLQLRTEFVGAGGWTFEQHWEQSTTRRAAVERGGWDYVVLQEQTRRPYEDTPKFKSYATRFDGMIRAVGAKTVLYLTWAPGNELDKQEPLNAAYGSLGHELHAPVIPAGPAFAATRAANHPVRLYGGDGRHPSQAGTYLAACVFYAWLRQRSPEGRAWQVFEEADAFQSLDAGGAQRLQRIAWETWQAWQAERGGGHKK